MATWDLSRGVLTTVTPVSMELVSDCIEARPLDTCTNVNSTMFKKKYTSEGVPDAEHKGSGARCHSNSEYEPVDSSRSEGVPTKVLKSSRLPPVVYT